MNNPIIDNRMVSSYTYAVRLLSFYSHLFPKDGTYPKMFTSPCDEEEFEYMCHVACDLLNYQVKTCPPNEKWYFNNLVKDYKSTGDIIDWCCEFNPSFLRYLKSIGAYRK